MALLLAAASLIAPAPASGAGEDETKLKLTFVPCVAVGEDDAGGELEWESDTQSLKVEIWGATHYAGETIILALNDVPVGNLLIAEETGRVEFEAADFDLPDSDTGYAGTGIYPDRGTGLPTGVIFSSDLDCDRD